MKKILVSSCFLGTCCKYDGGHNKNETIMNLTEENMIPVCPEVLGGLPTPREPAEIIGGDGFSVLNGDAKVKNISGKDVTSEFVTGAYKSLKIALENHCSMAILKANSPSCGNKQIYNGKFSGEKIDGMGLTAALLTLNNIKVFSEKEDIYGLLERNR